MLVYNSNFSYDDPLNIVFLCGNKYTRTDLREKRNILKDFLETNLADCRAIILEEHFIFGRTNMQYLAYDDAFLNGLAQVEQLASLYADRVIIVHETISTAAELGMFAINPELSKRICLLTPDNFSIEERKVTSFIKLAFMNSKAHNTKIGKQIIFYPDIEVNKVSTEKSDYYTYFHNNEIGEHLGKKIIAFVSRNKAKAQIKIAKSPYGKPSQNSTTVDYSIDGIEKMIHVYVHMEALKSQLLSLFFVEEYRKEFRLLKAIKDHVTFICNKYEEILINTIADLEGIAVRGYSLKSELKGTKICKFRQAVGYFLYMLQAIGFIGLTQQEGADVAHRKIRISTKMDDCKKNLDGILHTKVKTEFERLNV